MSSEQQPKILFDAVVKITTYRAGMLSARTSTVHFCSRLKEATLTGLPLPCSSGSTKKRRNRWSEVVQNIDFSNSSRKAWSILNNRTVRSRRSPCHCAVSANVIASQLIKNSDVRVLTGSHLDSFRKKCQIFGGPLKQVQ